MFGVIVEFPKMKVGVATRDERVVELRFLPPSSMAIAPKNPLAERAARQLERYRNDPDTMFELPLQIEGSELQRRVWEAMCAIPRGRTRTYGELAREIGADAGGFGHASGGYLLEVKRWLLAHEAPTFELSP